MSQHCNSPTRLSTVALWILALSLAPSGAETNLLQNGDFEAGTAHWAGQGAKRYNVVPALEGVGTVLGYQKSEDKHNDTENAHFDQVFAVNSAQLYVAGVRVKAPGDLRPVLRLADMNWNTLGVVASRASEAWQELSVVVRLEGSSQVRFQLFGGSHGEIRQTYPGVAFFDDAFVRPATEAERKQYLTCRVTVRADRPIRPIDPLFFGSNTLFMIDDDAALADGRIAACLRDMPCRLLRYPGGDVADNYHWQTHSLDNPRWWPGKQGPQTTDTDEFMAFCRQVGAEPIFVVNLESGFVRKDLAASAKEAADWVRFCNVEKGYGVKRWEIGNETYLYNPGKHKRVPVTAQQYADAYLRISAAMKEVDPSVRTGAIGPLEPNRVVSLGECRDTAPWWPTVVKTAGDRLDFVVVHEYAPARFGARNSRAQAVRTFRSFLEQHCPERHMPVALTEWNLNKGTNGTDGEQAVLLAERAGEYLLGGIDWATFWPLRIGGGDWGRRGLLDLDTNEPQTPYRVLSLLARSLSGDLVQVECNQNLLAAYAAKRPEGVTIVLCNLNSEPEGLAVEMSLAGAAATAASCEALTAAPGDAPVQPATVAFERAGDTWLGRLPPYTVGALHLRP